MSAMAKALAELFGVDFHEIAPGRRYTSVFSLPETVNAGHLFKACELLKCKPEQLDISWDESGCYYPGDRPEFWIEVKAR